MAGPKKRPPGPDVTRPGSSKDKPPPPDTSVARPSSGGGAGPDNGPTPNESIEGFLEHAVLGAPRFPDAHLRSRDGYARRDAFQRAIERLKTTWEAGAFLIEHGQAHGDNKEEDWHIRRSIWRICASALQNAGYDGGHVFVPYDDEPEAVVWIPPDEKKLSRRLQGTGVGVVHWAVSRINAALQWEKDEHVIAEVVTVAEGVALALADLAQKQVDEENGVVHGEEEAGAAAAEGEAAKEGGEGAEALGGIPEAKEAEGEVHGVLKTRSKPSRSNLKSVSWTQSTKGGPSEAAAAAATARQRGHGKHGTQGGGKEEEDAGAGGKGGAENEGAAEADEGGGETGGGGGDSKGGEGAGDTEAAQEKDDREDEGGPSSALPGGGGAKPPSSGPKPPSFFPSEGEGEEDDDSGPHNAEVAKAPQALGATAGEMMRAAVAGVAWLTRRGPGYLARYIEAVTKVFDACALAGWDVGDISTLHAAMLGRDGMRSAKHHARAAAVTFVRQLVITGPPLGAGGVAAKEMACMLSSKAAEDSDVHVRQRAVEALEVVIPVIMADEEGASDDECDSDTEEGEARERAEAEAAEAAAKGSDAEVTGEEVAGAGAAGGKSGGGGGGGGGDAKKAGGGRGAEGGGARGGEPGQKPRRMRRLFSNLLQCCADRHKEVSDPAERSLMAGVLDGAPLPEVARVVNRLVREFLAACEGDELHMGEDPRGKVLIRQVHGAMACQILPWERFDVGGGEKGHSLGEVLRALADLSRRARLEGAKEISTLADRAMACAGRRAKWAASCSSLLLRNFTRRREGGDSGDFDIQFEGSEEEAQGALEACCLVVSSAREAGAVYGGRESRPPRAEGVAVLHTLLSSLQVPRRLYCDSVNALTHPPPKREREVREWHARVAAGLAALEGVAVLLAREAVGVGGAHGRTVWEVLDQLPSEPGDGTLGVDTGPILSTCACYAGRWKLKTSYGSLYNPQSLTAPWAHADLERPARTCLLQLSLPVDDGEPEDLADDPAPPKGGAATLSTAPSADAAKGAASGEGGAAVLDVHGGGLHVDIDADERRAMIAGVVGKGLEALLRACHRRLAPTGAPPAAASGDALALPAPPALAGKDEGKDLIDEPAPEGFPAAVAAYQAAWAVWAAPRKDVIANLGGALSCLLCGVDHPSPMVKHPAMWALHHIMAVVGRGELMYAGEVVLAAVSRNIPGCDEAVWPACVSSAAAAARLVDGLDQRGGSFQAVVDDLLTEIERHASELPRRRALLPELPGLLEAMGLTTVRHLSRLLSLLLEWLEAPDDETVLGSLSVMGDLLANCWPRVHTRAADTWKPLKLCYMGAADRPRGGEVKRKVENVCEMLHWCGGPGFRRAVELEARGAWRGVDISRMDERLQPLAGELIRMPKQYVESPHAGRGRRNR